MYAPLLKVRGTQFRVPTNILSPHTYTHLPRALFTYLPSCQDHQAVA